MRNRIDNRLAAGLVLGLFTLATAASVHAAQVDPTTPPAACSVSVSSDSVVVSANPVTVSASTTEAVGDSLSAAFPAESKIVVASVAAAAPNAVKLTLNTSAAAPGEWPLSIKGTAGVCAGKLKVVAATK